MAPIVPATDNPVTKTRLIFTDRSVQVVQVRTDPSVVRPRVTPALVRRYSCPNHWCKAAAGSPCLGTSGPRKSHHIERVRACQAAQMT